MLIFELKTKAWFGLTKVELGAYIPDAGQKKRTCYIFNNILNLLFLLNLIM